MTLAIDTILENRYRIDRLIGQGGMGAIYQGYDSNLDVDVAIKENFFQTPQSIHQFQQEARILAKLHHAALPRVMYHFSMAGQQYLVMDYIEGEDLWQMIKRLKRPLDEAQAVRYMLQICDAVQYLHEQQPPIIHRDIKPQNIKVTPKGQAVLVDFGIAKVAEQGALTSTGARGVTPGFSPPEQYSGEGTTPRSDIYALGATLYALLTAEKPPDSISLLTGKVKFDTLGQSKFNLSEPLLQAIRHAMQPLESNRPASVADWQAELTGQVAPPPMPMEARQTVMAEVKTLVPTEILPEPTVIETQGTFSQSPTVVETQSVASQSPTVVETQATDLRFPTEVETQVVFSPLPMEDNPTPPKSSSNMGMWLAAGAVVIIGFLIFMMSGGMGQPMNATDYIIQGNAYKDSGKLEQAMANFNQAIKLDPNNAEAYLHRGNAYLLSDKLEEAIADYTQAIKLNPQDAGPYFFRGNAYIRSGKLEKAMADYTQSIKLNPQNTTPYNNLCWASSLLGKASEVMDTCNKAVELDPSGFPNDARGLARALTGDSAGAIEDFKLYVVWAMEHGQYEKYGAERQHWITELLVGRNPFDKATLEKLRKGE